MLVPLNKLSCITILGSQFGRGTHALQVLPVNDCCCEQLDVNSLVSMLLLLFEGIRGDVSFLLEKSMSKCP
jgi:hypothetical protein